MGTVTLTNVQKPSPFAIAAREIRGNKLALVAVTFLAIMVILALGAPFFTAKDPNAIDLVGAKLVPPFFVEGGRWEFLLGTDGSGRDVFARILYGGRISLFLGFVPNCIALLLGAPLGLISGYLGGRADEFLMRVNDALLAFPSILLALIIVAFLGQGILNLMFAVGLSYTPTFARVIRSSVLAERNKDYVASACSLGASHKKIIWTHIFPNVTSSLIVVFTLSFASALLEAAGLSFLGLGVRPPTPEWGAMLAEGKDYFYNGWWIVVFPGTVIFLVVIALNIVGDTLREVLDPKALKKH
jgi:dipeptide transport system permease protein